MSPLEALSDEELFEQTKMKVGIALRANQKSAASVLLWSRALDCEDEWRRRGKHSKWLDAYTEERQEAKR